MGITISSDYILHLQIFTFDYQDASGSGDRI